LVKPTPLVDLSFHFRPSRGTLSSGLPCCTMPVGAQHPHHSNFFSLDGNTPDRFGRLCPTEECLERSYGWTKGGNEKMVQEIPRKLVQIMDSARVDFTILARGGSASAVFWSQVEGVSEAMSSLSSVSTKSMCCLASLLARSASLFLIA